MKNYTHLIVLLLIPMSIILLNTSCQSNSKLSQQVHSFFMSKRYKKELARNHYLDSLNQVLRNDTTQMGKNLRTSLSNYNLLHSNYMQLSADKDELTSKNAALQVKYEELTNSTLTATQKLTVALKNKEAEIKEREIKLKELQSIVHRQDSITNALENSVKKALLGFKSDELSVEIKNGKVYVSLRDKLLFKSGSAVVEDKGKEAIKKLIDALNKDQDLDILVEGHTDNVPIKTEIYKDNWDLSVARATSIVRSMTADNKLNPKRVVASGRGEFFPVASNDTPDGRAKNRRTEIILSPKLDELMQLLKTN